MRIQVARSSMPDFEAYCQEIRPLWESHWLTNNGEKALALEAALQDALQTPNAVLFSNGHLALEAAIRAMGITGEAITTPFTFISTTHALVRCGVTPVFADVRPGDLTLDPSAVERLITERTTAIVPVHVYGGFCDVDALQRIADRHGLKLLYDAAHAYGATLGGRTASAFGDAQMYSFHATKVFHTIEGGAVTCQSSALADALRLERNFGITGPEETVTVGGNAKMNEFQAAMGLCNLRGLAGELGKRRAVVRRYRKRLADVPGLRMLPEHPGDNFAYLPVLFEGFRLTRDTAYSLLAAHDVFARKYFYPLTTAMACYAERFDPAATPVALRASENVLTLPLYADLSLPDVDRICDILFTEGV